LQERCEDFSFIFGFRRAVSPPLLFLFAPKGLEGRAVQAQMNIMAIQTTTVLGPETKHQYLQIDLKVIRTLIARFRMIVKFEVCGYHIETGHKDVRQFDG
jgi:hypothetical protein